MHISYKKLFSTLTLSAEQIAERLIEYNENKADEQGIKVAKTMYDDYRQLHSKIDTDEPLTKKDYAKLLVCISIILNQIEAKIKTEQQIIEQYKTNIIPKINKLIHLDTEEEVSSKADEFFNVNEKENLNS